MKRGSYGFGSGHRFDRIWFRGAVWAQGFMAGTARRFAEGRRYCLSDHFAVYGLLDVHSCHSRAGVAAVREKRRVDLGTLRDMECGRLREYVRGQEQLSIDADRQAQLCASEEQLQDMLRLKRQAVKQHRERDMEMRSIVNGDASLFNASLSGFTASEAGAGPNEYSIAEYGGLLGAGGAAAWSTVPGGFPRPRAYDSGFGNVNCAVQLLHRLLPVVLWLEQHARLCSVDVKCIVCALRRCREGMGALHSGVLVRGDEYRPAPGGWEGTSCAGYFEWIVDKLLAREQTMARVSTSIVGGDCDAEGVVTHIDRLFGYRVEERRVCAACGTQAVDSWFERVWRVSTSNQDTEGVTVTELLLKSCAVVMAVRQCAICSCECEHHAQRRLVSLPNLLMVRIDRGVVDVAGGAECVRVRVEEQLVLALFGLENMELAGVCYERGWRHSSCAVRSPDGAFWYFKNDREPWCLGREIDDVLPGQVTVIVFQRRGGAADFGGVCAAVPRAAAVPQPRSISLAGSASCDQSSVGAGGSGGGAQAERMKFLFGLRNLYWDTSPRTFADVYFGRDSNAVALVRYKNTLCMVCAVFAGFPESVRDGLVVRVMLCLSAKRPLSPSAETVEHFGAFVAACQLGGVTLAEFEDAAVASKALTEAALHKAYMKRRQEDAKRLMARRQRELGKEAVAKRRRESADRTGREAMEATLLQGAGAAGHRVRKQETASLGDRVAASSGTRVVGGETGDLADAVVARGMAVQSGLHADAAEGRADTLARRGVNPDAERRMKDKSAARARLHEMAMGARSHDAKQLTSAEVARQAQAASAAAAAARSKCAAASSSTGSRSKLGSRLPGTGADAQEEKSVRVDENLAMLIPHHGIGQGILAQVEADLGDGLERLNADWSFDWHGWTELIGQVAELATKRAKSVAACEAEALTVQSLFELDHRAGEFDAEIEVVERDFMDRATAFVNVMLRQFYVLSNQNAPIPGRTDRERCQELLSQMGLRREVGQVWGRNDCCADSLLQLLIKHGVLSDEINAASRGDACLANRRELWAASDALKPKAYDGTPNWYAYLEVDRHAEVIVQFFLRHFRSFVGSVPAAGFEIVVFTRFDTEDGRRPPFRMRICAQVGSQGQPLQLYMYNSSGTGMIGFHYDPMTSVRGRGAASLVCSEGDGSPAAVDLAAGDACAAAEPVGAPVIQEISGDAERQVEAEAIARRLDKEGGLTEIDMDQNQALASAVRMSLMSMEETEIEEALRRSLEALDVGAASAVVSGDGAMLASTDDALGSVVEAEASADPERRRVMRRVGQSQHQMRRLRRGNTLTAPSGLDAVDVLVSQGRLRLDSSDDACASHVAKPLESSGLATPVTGAMASDDEQEEGGSSSLDKQIPCYSRPLRRRASKVEMPSLPALLPVPVSRTRGAVERVERAGSTAASGVDCGGGGDDAMAANTVPDGARMLRGQIDVQSSHATATDNAAMVGAAVVRRSVRIAAHRSAGSGVAGASVDPVDDGGRGRSAGRRGAPPVRGRGRGQGRS